ncbi:MAG: hypothetical protein A2259_05315 [Candidatus Moranbacteria bacterium RIFOXYA2_FULL_43_15]|nr:MAG: hypothetical protein A2259_05315 [Candidatus Moranbacteria bacterium RIFOXYA2_FULL_43_15]
MLRRLFSVLVLALALTSVGCAGTNYNVPGPGGMMQGGRTGAFGTDNSWVYIPPSAPVDQPAKILLEENYSRTEDSWEQKCPDPRQRKNFKHNEVKERRAKEVLNPAAESTGGAFWAGGNPSTGNVLLPAVVEAAGIAASGGLSSSGDMINSIGNVEANSRSDSNAEINIKKGGKRHGGHDDHGHDDKGNCKR